MKAPLLNTYRMSAALKFLGVGWYIATCILGSMAGGYILDRWLDLSPLFALLGLAVGLVVAGIGMYRMIVVFLGTDLDTNGEGKG